MNRNKEHRPNGAAAEGGRPIGGAAEGGASVFFVSAHLSFSYYEYLWICLICSLYIPYIFPNYVPYIFPCVFLNLWSQQKTNPYLKPDLNPTV